MRGAEGLRGGACCHIIGATIGHTMNTIKYLLINAGFLLGLLLVFLIVKIICVLGLFNCNKVIDSRIKDEEKSKPEAILTVKRGGE